ESPVTRRRAVQTVASLQAASLDDRLTRVSEDARESIEVRLDALSAIIGRKPRLTEATFVILLQQLGARTNPVARLAASDVLRRSRLTDAQTMGALKAIRGDPLIRPDALLPAFQESTGVEATTALLNQIGELVRGGWQPSSLEFDNMLVRWPADARATAGI